MGKVGHWPSFPMWNERMETYASWKKQRSPEDPTEISVWMCHYDEFCDEIRIFSLGNDEPPTPLFSGCVSHMDPSDEDYLDWFVVEERTGVRGSVVLLISASRYVTFAPR